MKKPFHPPHSLIGMSGDQLNALEEAGEISEGDALGARWRKALIDTGLGAATADRQIKRHLLQQKAATENETK